MSPATRPGRRRLTRLPVAATGTRQSRRSTRHSRCRRTAGAAGEGSGAPRMSRCRPWGSRWSWVIVTPETRMPDRNLRGRKKPGKRAPPIYITNAGRRPTAFARRPELRSPAEQVAMPQQPPRSCAPVREVHAGARGAEAAGPRTTVPACRARHWHCRGRKPGIGGPSRAPFGWSR